MSAAGSNSAKMKDATKLTKVREGLGLSMREFAKEIGVTHASISQWENGEHRIPGPVMKLIEIYEQKIKKSK